MKLIVEQSHLGTNLLILAHEAPQARTKTTPLGSTVPVYPSLLPTLLTLSFPLSFPPIASPSLLDPSFRCPLSLCPGLIAIWEPIAAWSSRLKLQKWNPWFSGHSCAIWNNTWQAETNCLYLVFTHFKWHLKAESTWLNFILYFDLCYNTMDRKLKAEIKEKSGT